MTSDQDFVTALDLGSTRFRVMVADADNSGQLRILALASCPAEGMRRGEFVDLPAAAAVLRDLVEDVWSQADVEPQPVNVAVGGEHVRSLDSRSSLPLANHGSRVTEEHVAMLHERVRTIDVPFDRVILHCLPVEYTVDDRIGLSNPVGLVGTRLALEAHVITGTQSAVGAVQQAIELAGLQLGSSMFTGRASALTVTEERERAGGCLVIDIGAESTHYALFHRGCLRRSGAVPVGGGHVTRDLAWGLELEEAAAEGVKRRWATALRTRPVPRGTDDREMAPPADVQARIGVIAEARQQEILELVASDLQWGITRPVLTSGIVLTGGGSRLHGTEALAEQVFGVRAECRRPVPDDHGDEPESWAAAMGVARSAQEERPVLAAAAAAGGGLLDTLQRWISHLV